MPPIPPEIMEAMMSSLGGVGGPGGFAPGPGGGFPAPPPGAGPGGFPSAPPSPPPTELDMVGQQGLSALDSLGGMEPNSEVRIETTRKVLDTIHKMVLALMPTIGIDNMDLAKQLHIIGRQVADVRINLSKQNEAGIPPEAMIGGIRSTGIPGVRS